MKKWIASVVAVLFAAAVFGELAAPPLEVRKTSRTASPVMNPKKMALRATPQNAVPFDLPLKLTPTYDDFQQFIIVNANEDGKTWISRINTLMYEYDYDNAADDWAFIPVNLTEEKNLLTLSFELKAAYNGDKEDLDVCFGNAPEASAMTVLMKCDQFNNTTYADKQHQFSWDGAGVGYIGFHARSAAYMSGMNVRNISLEAAGSPDTPLAPVIVSSEVTEAGYAAKVKLPSENVLGEALPDEDYHLSVTVDGTPADDTYSGRPGAEIGVVLALEAGKHTIAYAAYKDAGDPKTWSDAVTDEVTVRNTGPRSLPFGMLPTGEEFETDCITLNANGDDGVWSYDAGLKYTYGSKDADDWVFLPVIDFGAAGGSFILSLDAKVETASCPEAFEVCVGREAKPESMTRKVLVKEGLTNRFFETFTERFSLPEGGNWYVGIHATSTTDGYNLYVNNINIVQAPDLTPAAPEIVSSEFDGMTGTLTVKAPAQTAGGVALTGAVALVATVDNVEYARAEGVMPGATHDFPMTLALGKHFVSVAAVAAVDGELLAGASATKELTVTNPEGYVYALPFYMRPTKGEFETLAVLSADGDGATWDYNAGADNGKGAMVCRTAGDAASDDWVFFPKFAIEDAGRIYRVSIDARAYLDRFPETFDVCVGREPNPEAMTVVLSEQDMDVYLYKTFSADFVAPEAGSYLIGIHRRSPGTAHTLSVKDVRFEDSGRSLYAPSACTDTRAVADATGALQVTVHFKMPSLSLAGEPLDPSDVLTASITGVDGQTASVTGAPGSEQQLTVAAKEGHGTLALCVASAANGAGDVVEVAYYSGLDKPVPPAVVAVVNEDNLSMTLTWTDCATGQNGGVVDASALAHNVYVPLDASGESWYLIEELPAGTTSYTYENKQTQGIAIVGVASVNAKGTSDLGLAYAVIGAPYALPVNEDWRGGEVAFQPLTVDTPTDEYSGQWFIDRPGLVFPGLADNQDMALLCMETAETAAKYGRVSLPKFTTADAPRVRASFNVYVSDRSTAAGVYANAYGLSDVKVGDLPGEGEAGWRKVSFDLPESLLGRQWVNFYIKINFDQYPRAFAMNGYSVERIYEKQLSLSLLAPEKVLIGEDAGVVTAVVTNHSEGPLALPALSCCLQKADGEAVTLEPASRPAAAELAPKATAEYTYQLTATADNLGVYELTVEFVDFEDEVPADNRAEAAIEFAAGDCVVVTDLDGTLDGGALRLTWTRPAMQRIGDDDVESYEAFTYERNIGPWLNIDGDGKDVYGPFGESSVGYPGQFEPKAFQVVNFASLGLDTDLQPYSGEQFFMAITPEDGSKADDWLISPEVKGGTEVSFRFNILSADYGTEQIDLLYSETGREPADFKLLQTFSQNRRGWNPLKAVLPAEAKYFAFHYRCADIFGVCLDDIFYSPVQDSEILGYNVYRNGAKIAGRVGEENYTDAEAKKDDVYHVTVVTNATEDGCEHPLSNTYVNVFSTGLPLVGGQLSVMGGEGCLTVKGQLDSTLRIYSVSGHQVLALDALPAGGRIALPCGCYVVRAGGQAVKAVVR